MASSTRRMKAALGGKESQEHFLSSLVEECDAVREGLSLLLKGLEQGPVLGQSQPTTEIVSKCRALHACNVKLLEVLAATQPVERKKRVAPAPAKTDENLANGGGARKLRSSSSGSSSIVSGKGVGSKKASGKSPRVPRAVAAAAEVAAEFEVETVGSLRSILTPIAASAPSATSPPSLPSNEGTPVLADWRMSGATPRRNSPSLIPGPSHSKCRTSKDDSSMHTPLQHWAAVSSPVSSGNTPQTPQMASPLTQTLLRNPATEHEGLPHPATAATAASAADEASWAALRPAASAAKSALKTPGLNSWSASRGRSTPSLTMPSLPTPAALSDSRDDDASPQMLSPPKLSTLLQPRSASRR